jgi:hypothetical protein
MPIAAFRSWVDRLTTEPGTDGVRRWDRALPGSRRLGHRRLRGLSRLVFDGVPHNDQRRPPVPGEMLARGDLQVPAPPDTSAFGMTHMITRARTGSGSSFQDGRRSLSIGVFARVPGW